MKLFNWHILTDISLNAKMVHAKLTYDNGLKTQENKVRQFQEEIKHLLDKERAMLETLKTFENEKKSWIKNQMVATMLEMIKVYMSPPTYDLMRQDELARLTARADSLSNQLGRVGQSSLLGTLGGSFGSMFR